MALGIEERRCGTCNWFPNHHRGIGCYIGNYIHRFNGDINKQERIDMQENDGQHCPDWKEKVKEDTQFPQCQTCANWQDKIHHTMHTGEPVYECKKLKFVFPTDTRTGICNCWEKPKEKSEVINLTKDQIIANRKHNQQYLNLDDTEILLHEKLMQSPMNHYPKDFYDYLDKEHKGDPICGDAFSCWLADWIKTLRDKSKEKRRIWTCLNCGKDIYFDEHAPEKYRNYYHVNSNNTSCNPEHFQSRNHKDYAIPKPDSERWVDV